MRYKFKFIKDIINVFSHSCSFYAMISQHVLCKGAHAAYGHDIIRFTNGMDSSLFLIVTTLSDKSKCLLWEKNSSVGQINGAEQTLLLVTPLLFEVKISAEMEVV